MLASWAVHLRGQREGGPTRTRHEEGEEEEGERRRRRGEWQRVEGWRRREDIVIQCKSEADVEKADHVQLSEF